MINGHFCPDLFAVMGWGDRVGGGHWISEGQQRAYSINKLMGIFHLPKNFVVPPEQTCERLHP
jgi:hypothetical protein